MQPSSAASNGVERRRRGSLARLKIRKIGAKKESIDFCWHACYNPLFLSSAIRHANYRLIPALMRRYSIILAPFPLVAPHSFDPITRPVEASCKSGSKSANWPITISFINPVPLTITSANRRTCSKCDKAALFTFNQTAENYIRLDFQCSCSLLGSTLAPSFRSSPPSSSPPSTPPMEFLCRATSLFFVCQFAFSN